MSRAAGRASAASCQSAPIESKPLRRGRARSSMRIVMSGSRSSWFLLAPSGAYLVAGALWIYLVVARSDDYGGDPGWWWFVGAAFVLGLVTARWPTIVVPMLLAFIAAGAGRGTNPDSDVPIALGLLFVEMPIAAVAAAVGVSVSRLMRRSCVAGFGVPGRRAPEVASRRLIDAAHRAKGCVAASAP
jgi:hypothetical protein